MAFCSNFCVSLARKLQVLAIGVIFRLCVLYVVYTARYDLIAKDSVLEFEVLGISFLTYTLIVLVVCGLIMVMDAVILLFSVVNPYSAIRMIFVSWMVHGLLVLPIIGTGLYIGYSADITSNNYKVDWMDKYKKLDEVCSHENATTYNFILLEEVRLLAETLSAVESEIRCCGWNGPDDYMIKFCPNLQQNNTQFPWWAKDVNQTYPYSCCPNSKLGVDCSINEHPQWFKNGCREEFYDFVYRVLLAINYTQLASELVTFVVQLWFLYLMRNVQVPQEFKQVSSEDENSLRKLEMTPLVVESSKTSKKSSDSTGSSIPVDN